MLLRVPSDGSNLSKVRVAVLTGTYEKVLVWVTTDAEAIPVDAIARMKILLAFIG
jgi:hypothetical protein